MTKDDVTRSSLYWKMRSITRYGTGMRTRGPIIVLLALLASACESPSQRSALYAEKCSEMEGNGFLEPAEQLCESAWYDVDSGRLAPAVQSERLYDLGRIKRKLGKHAEAEPLLRQSLAIEEGVSGPASPASGLRRVQLALLLAAQDKWNESTGFLEPVLEVADQFPEREQRAAANVFNHYARRLRDSDQAELAERFAQKAAELKAASR